ncbi:rho GTPase-activating protein 27-like isoform X2 [Chrysoperla carnea]|uniref:rho GTPase-activating protein 27-like isoform X2 n=1 Tax=Chrysoperla carnea TaxID=189513 RepID=UPI001D090F95|nr:rho GTPase-activating protein 27-like isoform X2 [Chrysoperla carnea]
MYNSNENNLTPPLHKDIDALWLAKDMILPEPRSPSPVNFDTHSSPDVCLREHTNRCYRKTERQCLYLPNPQYLKLESTSSSSTSSSGNSLESIIFESIENVHKLDDDPEDMYNKSNINEIFDTEDNVVPPIPPARKKRKEVIYENIWECRKTSSEDIKYEQFENDSEELSSPSNYDEVLTQASCSSGVDDFDFYTSVSSIDENIYENIPTPKYMYPQLHCRLWQSTPNLYLCAAEEVNIAYEIVTPIHNSTLLTVSKLDLLCDRVTVRKNSVTSDIFEWNRSLLRSYSSESSFTVMEEKSLLADSNFHSAESSPVQLRKRDTLSPTPSTNNNYFRQNFLTIKSKSFVRFDSHRTKQLVDENTLIIVKEGKIDRSKIVDCNRKQKKWIQNSYGCLTKKSFYLFENKKIFDTMKAGVKDKRNYDIKIDLKACKLDRKSEYTSRKNVLVLTDTLNGSVILLQFENQLEREDWYNCLSNSLEIVPITPITSTRPQTFIEGLQTSPKELNFKDQKRIKTKLKLFFGGRRPSVDDLIKNDEPVFGSELNLLCDKMERPKVPEFVKACVKAIEPHLETEGIYRASGNLSQIQKIRFEVDQHRYENLNVEKNDIHVLTGALKLFFRELKTSLIPPNEYDSCMEATDCHDINKTVSQLRKILKRFPDSHRDTLQFLMKHLLDVSKYEKENRMDVPNLATVWAPNLLEKHVTSSSKDFSMFVDCTLQMNLIKTFLNNYNDIFK